jgi:hypothetical protein
VLTVNINSHGSSVFVALSAERWSRLIRPGGYQGSRQEVEHLKRCDERESARGYQVGGQSRHTVGCCSSELLGG